VWQRCGGGSSSSICVVTVVELVVARFEAHGELGAADTGTPAAEHVDARTVQTGVKQIVSLFTSRDIYLGLLLMFLLTVLMSQKQTLHIGLG
jgi:hypothetical protein